MENTINTESAPISTTAAQAYADTAERLSLQTTLKPSLQLAYGTHKQQQLEVFEPEGIKQPPVLVFFHGGAWTHGGLEWLRFMAPAVLAMPAVFIAATYRLAPRNKWPAAYEDACSVLTAVHTLAKQRSYNTDRVIVGGHSAGGHLAALATLREKFNWLRACFPVSARFDLRTPDATPGSGEDRVYRYVLKHCEQDAEASPLLFLEGNRVPFHIVWGEQDFQRISTSSNAMVSALQCNGTRVSHHIVENADHFDTHLQLIHADNPWYARLQQEFLSC